MCSYGEMLGRPCIETKGEVLKRIGITKKQLQTIRKRQMKFWGDVMEEEAL